MKKSKKITALSLSFAFVLNTFATAIPVSAETAGESQVYAYEGYTVEYKIVNEWTGNQNIQVTITNTSDELISNWAVGYNASGEINGLWNAQIYGQQGTEYILSCASYNSEIVPGGSVNFGYTLTGDSFKFPQNIINCAERVDITDGYNVYYNIIGDYGDTYQAEMIIENLSDTDISAWQLSFDGNVTIDNLWNGKLIENTDGSFKVKNAEHNSVISTNNSASFNFGGTRITEDDTTIGESSDDSGMTVEADSNYDIIFDNYKLTGVVIPMEFEFEFDLELDSDEDGLPDYLERRIGSDRHNADTDGDELPDGYEYYTLGTDLKKTDSDDNGLSDADEDFDEEGLTNLEEYNLGTSPFNPDSDYDGLSDYDEINTYNTDPLNHDSDTDKVTDGDEVILGLDPNNPETNGYPDSEYTTEQTVSADSEALEYINNIEDNPYTVSVEITAAGVADNCLSADESGYSSAILQNDAVLGVVPELTYSDGLSVTDVVINFTLDDSVVENTLGVYADNPAFDGINRFNVFKFFEDTNTLLPIETSYNESTNTVSTHVDETGTYCLIDMEIWLNNIENMPAGNYYNESDNEPANIVFCLDTRSIIDSESFDAIKADIKAITEDAFSRYGEIKVYVYYQRFGSNFKVTNNLLKDSVTGENYFTGYEEAAKALDRLETYMIKSNFWAYDYVEATQYIIDNCDENIIAMYHITADDRVMGSVSGAKKLLQTVQNSKYTNKDDEEINRIYVSLLCPNSDKVIDSNSYVYELVEKSGGVIYTDATIDEELETETVEVPVFLAASTVESTESSTANDEVIIEEDTFADTVRDCIIGILGEGNGNEYKIISSTGLTTIKLDKPLTKDSDTDTDNDDLSDWKEVNTDLIIKLLVGDTVGDITLVNRKWSIPNYWLPTFEELKNNYSDLYYVEGGLAKWYDANDNGGNPLLNMKDVRVLPINSVPVDADGDNDGVVDQYDDFALRKGNINIHYTKIENYYNGEPASGYRWTNEHLSDDSITPFVVLQAYSTYKSIYNDDIVDIYRLPYSNESVIFSTNKSYNAVSVIQSEGNYWFKIYENNQYGYVRWDGVNNKDLIENAISYKVRYMARCEFEDYSYFTTDETKCTKNHDKCIDYLQLKYYTASQCAGFASLVYEVLSGKDAVFPKNFIYEGTPNCYYEGNDILLTEETAQTLLENIPIGSYIRCYYKEHSLIIAGKSTSNTDNYDVMVYHCNYPLFPSNYNMNNFDRPDLTDTYYYENKTCIITLEKLTFAEFAEKLRTLNWYYVCFESEETNEETPNELN